MIHTMRRLRKGSHLEKPQRRWVAWVVGLGVLAVAATAIAVLVSLRLAAPDEISARSVGEVDIGDAETEGMFLPDLGQIEPGFTAISCMNAIVEDHDAEDEEARFYVEQGAGDLADDITLELWYLTDDDATVPGHRDCADNDSTVAYTLLFEGTLAGLAGDHGTFGTGFDWPRGDNIQLKTFLELPDTVDGEEAAGQTATLQFAFENRGP